MKTYYEVTKIYEFYMKGIIEGRFLMSTDTMTKDEIFMREAIRLSRLAVEHGNEPFGAVLVKDGKIVFSNENQIYTRHDPTFHGEAGLIREFLCRDSYHRPA